MIKRHHYLPLFTRVFLICVYVVLGSIVSCAKNDDGAIEMLEFRGFPLDTSIVYFKPAEDPILPPMLEPELEGNLTLAPYAEFNTPHQSAAVYGDYAFLVMDGRQGIRLYDMAKGRTVYTLKLKAESTKVYHCNQSTFGVQAYEPADFFPLLYVSQRARSENRCLTEVFRIVPLFNADSTLIAFRTELVQEILFPPMSKENAMGHVNCVIDPKTGWMYTYSRNNVTADDNYALCRISRFAIPDLHQEKVVLEDADILDSFQIGVKATNMQGGCIMDDRLYIGQGYPYANYVYLNVVDLKEQRLVRRYDLLARGVDWEPEGCFLYGGHVMLSYKTGISSITEEE